MAWAVACTSCTRTMEAPARVACTAAMMEAPMRAEGGALRKATARNDFRLAPTATGTPPRRLTSVAVRVSSARLWRAFFMKPRPGSMTRASRGTP